MKRNFRPITTVTILLSLVLFGTRAANSSTNNLTKSYDPQTECLGVKLMVPPLVAFERISPNMDMGEASKIIALFAREEDQITVSLGEGG